jgi:Leucine-rich repeat (LRR) protein
MLKFALLFLILWTGDAASQVRTLEPLASLMELQVLIADHNCLEHMKGLGSLAMLGTLDVSCNKIHTLEELKNVMHLHMLRSLNLQQNHMETVTSSRMHTLHVLPQLTVLNDLDVRQQDKTYASNLQVTTMPYPSDPPSDPHTAPLCP